MIEVKIIECGKFFMKGQLKTDNFEPVNPGLVPALPKGTISGAKVEPVDTSRQENIILLSFILLISALLMRLAWIVYNLKL